MSPAMRKPLPPGAAPKGEFMAQIAKVCSVCERAHCASGGRRVCRCDRG